MDKTMKLVAICLFIAIIIFVAFILQTEYYTKAKRQINRQEREIEFVSQQLEQVTQAPTFTPEPTPEKTLKDYSPDYKIAYLRAKYPGIAIYKPPCDNVIGTEGCFTVRSFNVADKLYDLAKGYVSYYKIADENNVLMPIKICFKSWFRDFYIEYFDKEKSKTLYIEIKDRVYLSTKDWKPIVKDGVKYLYHEKKSEVSDKYYTTIRYDWQDKQILLYINDKLTDELLARYTELTKVEFHNDKKPLDSESEKLYSRKALDSVLKQNADIDYYQYYKDYKYGIFEQIHTKEAYVEIMRDVLEEDGYFYYGNDLTIQRFDVWYDGNYIELIYKVGEDDYESLRIIKEDEYRFFGKISGSNNTKHHDWGVINIDGIDYYYETNYNHEPVLCTSVFWKKDGLCFEFHIKDSIDKQKLNTILSKISYNTFR